MPNANISETYYVGPTYAVGALHIVFAWFSFFLPKFGPELNSATNSRIITIQKPLESSRTVGVHWLCHLPDCWFQNGRNCPKLPDRPPQISCPGLHSATTGPIITIQKTLESSRAVGVHWPKLPKTTRSATPKLLSGLNASPLACHSMAN